MTINRLKGIFHRYWPKLRSTLAYGLGPILGLASGPLLARAMGPDGRGQFAAIMQPLTLAGAVASIGIPAAATYFVAKGKYTPRSILLRGMMVSLFFASLAYGALVLYSGHLSASQNISRKFLLVVWVLVFVSAAIQIRRGFLQGHARWKTLDFERFFFAIARFAVVALLAVIGISNAEDYAVASLGAFVVAGIIVWWPLRVGIKNTTVDKVPYRRLTRFSLSAALGTIAVVANNRIDQVILPLMTSSREVGFYAIAVTVAEVPLILGTLAARDALYQSSRGSSVVQTLRGSILYLGGGVVIALLLAYMAPFYMTPIFGDAFAGAIEAVQILAVGTVFGCISLALTAIIAGTGRPAVSSIIPLSGLVTTTVMFISFQEQMSSNIAAFIAAFSQLASVVAGVLLLVALKKISKKEMANENTSISR